MTTPNVSTLWGEVLVEELVSAGVTGVCLAPGSRCTPLTVAFSGTDIDVYSHLDERSAAFFALGRSRRSGEPTALVCTSGTAAANFHPAVIEASQSRVPLVVLTADRPRELHDSGANQTIDQENLYGSAARDYRTLPEPGTSARKLRSLRVAADRAVSTALGTPPGPVHLNVPLAKPLEPTADPDSVPADIDERAPLGRRGREGAFVETTRGTQTLSDSDRRGLSRSLAAADRGLIVAGPANAPTPDRESLTALAKATGFPVLADPLSGHRFGHEDVPICGGYDSYLDAADEWPEPEVVVRFGASPTSKVLRQYLRDTDPRQFVVDPAGGWREAEFTATDLVVADPTALTSGVASDLSGGDTTGSEGWRERFERAERTHWDLLEETTAETTFEGGLLAAVARTVPDPATVMVGNSMPVRDLDRFGRPRSADVTVLGNRGASGIDGITSTALGAGSATSDPLVAVLGDISFYHDANGLLAVERCDVDATIVVVNNDGGGIFHILPIEQFDPPFTEYFKTPHGIDFEPLGECYGLEFTRVEGTEAFEAAFDESVNAPGSQIIEVRVDGEASHRTRERLHQRLCDRIE